MTIEYINSSYTYTSIYVNAGHIVENSISKMMVIGIHLVFLLSFYSTMCVAYVSNTFPWRSFMCSKAIYAHRADTEKEQLVKVKKGINILENGIPGGQGLLVTIVKWGWGFI